MTTHHHEEDHDDFHDRGLAFDLATLMQRRRALKLFSGAAVGATAVALVGCGDDKPAASSGTTTPASTTTAASGAGSSSTVPASGTAATQVAAIPTQTTPASACTAAIPKETGGPYPADGSNGPNVLTASGIVRSDIRSSFGNSNTVAKGVPLTIKLTIVDTTKACAPIAGAAVYLWHCDQEGRYSLYSPGATTENYLRGVQAADANGLVTFTTIFPAAYSGRWPHVHFEVYPTLAVASGPGNAKTTSQFALPEDICNTVFATAGYSASIPNMTRTTLKNDNVFSDGYALQMASVTGSVANGYTASLVVGV